MSERDQNASGLVDPELLDVLLQGISVLSNVATMAGTWLAYRSGTQAGQNQNAGAQDNIRVCLRNLRRSLEDCFESAGDALRILQAGTLPEAGSASLMRRRPRFGNSVYLSPAELSRLNGNLATLDNAAMTARGNLRTIQSLVQQSGMPNTDHVEFEADSFNADLNSVLFDSETFEDAIIKLRDLQNRADDFVTELNKALRSN